VFNSHFSESKLEINSDSPLTNGDTKILQSPRRLVKILDDFDLFHIILFYLYTDRICFTTMTETSQFDIPTTNDAEGIYAIAHRLMLDSLTVKALHFLESSCTPQNITARAFGKFGITHEVVGDVYDEYFMKHWDEVIQTKEFEGFFQAAENDAAESVRVNAKLRDMIRNRSD
jgi:hypothetical protein